MAVLESDRKVILDLGLLKLMILNRKIIFKTIPRTMPAKNKNILFEKLYGTNIRFEATWK